MAHLRGPFITRKGTAYNVCWRDPDGRFRSERVYGGIRKAEARAKAVDAAKHEGSPETVDNYRALLRLHAYPAFGTRRVGTIKPGDVGRWINDLKVKPRASLRQGTLHARWKSVRRCTRGVKWWCRPQRRGPGDDPDRQVTPRDRGCGRLGRDGPGCARGRQS